MAKQKFHNCTPTHNFYKNITEGNEFLLCFILQILVGTNLQLPANPFCTTQVVLQALYSVN